MASMKILSKGKSKLLATLVTGDRKPCAFCLRDVDDEATYGKLYAIGDLQVHYFCALLSCCLVQKGKDSEGLFGFLYHDIAAEVERSKKHKCSYCNTGGASLGCSVSQCRKQFHLPCGRGKNAVSLFYGNYKSFCQQHAPKQKIPEHIMSQARLRMKRAKSALTQSLTSLHEGSPETDSVGVCVICYEAVSAFPSPNSIWPPCCARDAWFHRSCVQRMALSAGMHYLKCPLCNDKDHFCDAVMSQGLYVPDRDAAWELEQDAFAEIYERPSTCSAEECLCPMGRSHDADEGEWDMLLCLLCGAVARHAACGGGGGARFVCGVCCACAHNDFDELADKLEQARAAELRRSRARAPPVRMPSRMSLRRTKARQGSSTLLQNNNSPASCLGADKKECQSSSGTTSARRELNLRTPRKPPSTGQTENQTPLVLNNVENTMFSPTKLVEEGLNNKIERLGVKSVNSDRVISKVKERLKKPRPLSVKKKIVSTVLDEILLNILQETHKPKERVSPKKSNNVNEISVEDNTENVEESTKKIKDIQDKKEGLNNEDDSSNSTFQLPSEFIADHLSDDSLPLFETPKKLTTVDIQKDSSLEISENDEKVNIDVVKIQEGDNANFIKELKLKFPVKTEKCAFKFNPSDKETLVENNLDMDVESFKNFYLNEVDRMDKEFECAFKHKHADEVANEKKLRTAIDFAVEATKIKDDRRKKLKRKLTNKDGVAKKKSKTDKGIIVRYKKDNNNSSNIKVVCSNEKDNTKTDTKTKRNMKKKKSRKCNENMTTIDLTVETAKTKRLKKLNKNKKRRENIHVKIRFREEKLKLEITKSHIKNKKLKIKKQKQHGAPKKLKQCILQYVGNSSPNKVIVKPEHDVTPKKRNYVKQEKSPDTLVQTSIQNFFKKIPTCQ